MHGNTMFSWSLGSYWVSDARGIQQALQAPQLPSVLHIYFMCVCLCLQPSKALRSLLRLVCAGIKRPESLSGLDITIPGPIDSSDQDSDDDAIVEDEGGQSYCMAHRVYPSDTLPGIASDTAPGGFPGGRQGGM